MNTAVLPMTWAGVNSPFPFTATEMSGPPPGQTFSFTPAGSNQTFTDTDTSAKANQSRNLITCHLDAAKHTSTTPEGTFTLSGDVTGFLTPALNRTSLRPPSPPSSGGRPHHLQRTHRRRKRLRRLIRTEEDARALDDCLRDEHQRRGRLEVTEVEFDHRRSSVN
jgi:hypothetical protein